MRLSLPLTALFCASSITALPFTTSSDVKVRSAIPEFRVTGRTFEVVSDEDCDCDNENPISGIVDTFLAGGDIGAGIHTILGDANFGQHVIDLSTNADFLVKFNKLCGSAEFIAQLDVLFSNDAFLDTCTGLVADGNFGLQLGVLFTNVDFVKRFSAGISSDAFISLFGAHFGAGFDFGAKFSGYFSSGAFVKFFVSLCGKGAIGGKLGLLFGDSIFLEKFGALLNLKAGFAAGLGGLLADVGFMTHICGTLGLGVDLTAKFVALFGAKASFAAQLELILGASFNGKFGALFGAGSCTDLLVGFFGSLSFNQICGGGFSGGAFFKTWAGLILEGDFAVKFCGFLGAYISAKVGFAVWIGQIFADKVFCVALLGLFGIKSVLSIGLCAILGGVGLIGIVANFVTSTLGTILSGTLGIFGKLFGGAKGGYGY